MRWLILAMGLVACGCPGPARTPVATEPAAAPEPAIEPTGAAPREVAVFSIDGKEVDRPAWDAKIATLTGDVRNWSCAETNRGGITSWIQNDADGVEWRIREASDSVDGNWYDMTRTTLEIP